MNRSLEKRISDLEHRLGAPNAARATKARGEELEQLLWDYNDSVKWVNEEATPDERREIEENIEAWLRDYDKATREGRLEEWLKR